MYKYMYVLLVFLVSTSCVKKNEINYEKIVDDFPEIRYLVGLGEVPITETVVKSKEAARDKARIEIAKQIRVHVKSSFISIIQERKEEVKSNIESIIQSTTERTLTGIKIEREGIDRKNKIVWAIATLDRFQEGERLHEEIQDLYKEAKIFFDNGIRRIQSVDLFSGLCMLIKSREKLLAGMAKESEYKVIAGRTGIPEEFKRPFSLSDIDILIDDAITGIEMEKLSGDKQVTTAGKRLNKPLKILFYKESNGKKIPIQNMPITAGFERGGGETDQKVKTNAEGIAGINVYEVFYALPSNLIEVKVDLDAFSECASDKKIQFFDINGLLSSLKALKIQFTFESTGIPVFVSIKEKNVGRLRSESIVKAELVEFLNHIGKFKVIDEERIPVLIDTSKIETIFKGDVEFAVQIGKQIGVEYIITGKAESEYMGNTVYIPGKGEQEFQPFCNARIVLKCLDVNTCEIKFYEEISGVEAFGKTKEEAGLKALEKAAQMITDKLKVAWE